MTDKDGFEMLSPAFSRECNEIRITVHRAEIRFTKTAWRAMGSPKCASIWLNPVNKNLKIKYEPEQTLNVVNVTDPGKFSGTKRIVASSIVQQIFKIIGIKEPNATFRCVGKRGPDKSVIFDLRQAERYKQKRKEAD